jgi:RNA polymerase-binding transcription factor DksA
MNNLNYARYSENELEEYRGIIIEKKNVAQICHKMCVSSVTLLDGNGIQDTSPTFKVLEEGEATLSKEEAARLADHQKKHIEDLNFALIRIKNKTFGYCNCPICKGARIDESRLRAVPHSTKCINAKNNQK